jgi:hypothetical protein
MSDVMDLLGVFIGSMMAFFFLGRYFKYPVSQKSRLDEAKPPTQTQVAVEVKEAREEAKTSASQKVETLTQEVKTNAQDAEAAAAALRDSQL